MIFKRSTQFHTGTILSVLQSMNTTRGFALWLLVYVTCVQSPAELMMWLFTTADNRFVLASHSPYFNQGVLLLAVTKFVLFYSCYPYGTRAVKRLSINIIWFVCGGIIVYYLSMLLAYVLCYMDSPNTRLVVALH